MGLIEKRLQDLRGQLEFAKGCFQMSTTSGEREIHDTAINFLEKHILKIENFLNETQVKYTAKKCINCKGHGSTYISFFGYAECESCNGTGVIIKQ